MAETADTKPTFQEQIEALTQRANAAVAALEAGNPTAEQLAEVKAVLEGAEDKPGIAAQVQQLTEAHQAAQREVEAKAVQEKLTTLSGAIADLRKAPAADNFVLNGDNVAAEGLETEAKALLDAEDPYLDTEGKTDFATRRNLRRWGALPGVKGGFFRDVKLSNKGVTEARERLISGFEDLGLDAEGKALTEGTGLAVAAPFPGSGTHPTGGYLVRPQVERQIVLARELDNLMRGLCSSLNVTSNAITLDQLGLSATAGWVGELATKPESAAMTLSSLTANVFTAAGLVTISNQLLADSNPSVDALFTAELAKRLVALEETAFLAGTGTSNQPLGILNTPGIGATALTSTTILDLLDAILDAIAAVESGHGAPNAILMHPRTWTRILKARDAQGAYYIDPAGGPQDPRTGLRGPVKSLWGYPVVTTNRMPTNLGTGVNESRVIVGDFRECLILDRQGITVDQSEHVYFMQNATVFRGEMRVGFTAARAVNAGDAQKSAINVVGGAGLANG